VPRQSVRALEECASGQQRDNRQASHTERVHQVIQLLRHSFVNLRHIAHSSAPSRSMTPHSITWEMEEVDMCIGNGVGLHVQLPSPVRSVPVLWLMRGGGPCSRAGCRLGTQPASALLTGNGKQVATRC
jgi:hypothetical protein